MTKSLTLILGAMLIVFSLTLMVGGAVCIFYLSPGAEPDKVVKAMLFWAGALISLFGLAGLLAGLVGVLGSVILKASETKEES